MTGQISAESWTFSEKKNSLSVLVTHADGEDVGKATYVRLVRRVNNHIALVYESRLLHLKVEVEY
jgi:tRNA(Phe) wybutosine-synthesizing methylase Tyw3